MLANDPGVHAYRQLGVCLVFEQKVAKDAKKTHPAISATSPT
jgi:hypothetical protein